MAFALKVVNTMFCLNIASNYCYCLFTIAKHRAKAIKPCYILHSQIDNLFPNSISMCFKMTYAPYVRCHKQPNRSRATHGSCSDDFICSRFIKIKQQQHPPKKPSSSSSSKISNNIHTYILLRRLKTHSHLEDVQFYF